jgi:hypothetical protein
MKFPTLEDYPEIQRFDAKGARFTKPIIIGIIGDMMPGKCDTRFDVSSFPEVWNAPIIWPVCSATAGNQLIDLLFT